MSNGEENQVKKSIERKKYSYIINILKKFVETTIITKHILNLKINFTISKLLIFASTVEKQLTKASSKDKAV